MIHKLERIGTDPITTILGDVVVGHTPTQDRKLQVFSPADASSLDRQSAMYVITNTAILIFLTPPMFGCLTVIEMGLKQSEPTLQNGVSAMPE